MKNKLFLLGIFALLVSCSYDPDELNDVGIQLAPQIKLEGSISQQYITRVDDEGFCHGDFLHRFGEDTAHLHFRTEGLDDRKAHQAVLQGVHIALVFIGYRFFRFCHDVSCGDRYNQRNQGKQDG